MTRYIKVSSFKPEKDKITVAAEIIKKGGIVAFPTETVYGLGANALNTQAVKKIFEAKGRPQDNPLIVHISHSDDLKNYVENIPEMAKKLMDNFWPGPMTLIFRKKPVIPDVITAGMPTVGIRMPSNAIARELITLSGVPIAAPSANISGKPSPTSAQHVKVDMDGKIDAIIDGGMCEIGLESTVIDASKDVPVILRPGGVTPEDVKKVCGSVRIDPAIMKKPAVDLRPIAPGMKYKHYAPDADLYIVSGDMTNVVKKIRSLAAKDISAGKKVGIMATAQSYPQYSKSCKIISLGNRENKMMIAENLFNALREFDTTGVDIIYAESVNQQGIGLAIMNRLIKAAGFKVINA